MDHVPRLNNIDIPLPELLKLRYQHNLSYAQLAKRFNRSPQAIHQRLQRFNALLDDPEQVKTYQDVRANFFDSLEFRFLSSIDDEAIKAMPVRDRVVSAGILYDKGRLERGQATSISAVASLDDKDLDQVIQAKLATCSKLGVKVTELICETNSHA